MSSQEELPHTPSLWIYIEVRDASGKVIHRHRQPGRSFLYNFMFILYTAFLGQSGVGPECPGSSCPTCSPFDITGANLSVSAPQGNDTYGILIGSGNTPNNALTCQLANKIPNSQVTYGSTSVQFPQGVGPGTNPITITITRQFTNNSGNSVTVAEVGLAIYGAGQGPLIARDVLTSPVTVPNNGILQVTYEIQLQIS